MEGPAPMMGTSKAKKHRSIKTVGEPSHYSIKQEHTFSGGINQRVWKGPGTLKIGTLK